MMTSRRLRNSVEGALTSLRTMVFDLGRVAHQAPTGSPSGALLQVAPPMLEVMMMMAFLNPPCCPDHRELTVLKHCSRMLNRSGAPFHSSRSTTEYGAFDASVS